MWYLIMKITDNVKCEKFYRALIERDPEYLGIFFVGVKTTGVFCISTCRARKPKRENVVFYTDFKSALDAGYRPCKICRPTENACTAPDFVEKAIELVRSNPTMKIADWELRENNISPESLRRWFKQNHGITFQAFQRMLRINSAILELKNGRSTIDVAFDSGYDSLSGFGYTYKKLTGHTPSEMKSIILINRFTSPIGPMFVCATEKGICLLEFVDRRMLETEFKELQNLLQARIMFGENEHILQAEKEISEYFSGNRYEFSIKLDTPGTAFQLDVWNHLRNVSYGHTESYKTLAERMGKPEAVRAVASANGANRVAIIIPCHRIIGKDGSMTGYGGGIERKKWLLEHEKRSMLKTCIGITP